jgi:hypothetical protein
MAIFAFSDGFFSKLVRAVAGGAGVVAFEGRVLELGALFFGMTGITTPRRVVGFFVRFMAILAGLRAEHGFLRVFYVLGGMAIKAIAGLDPRLGVWAVATRAIGPAVHVDGLLVSLGVLMATLAFPGLFAERFFGFWVFKIVAAHAMGSTHGGDRDVNVVVAFGASLVNGVLKTFNNAQMAACAHRAFYVLS